MQQAWGAGGTGQPLPESGRGPWRRASGSHKDRKGKQERKWHYPEKGHLVNGGASGGAVGTVKSVAASGWHTAHGCQGADRVGGPESGVPEEGVVSDAKSL